MATAQTTWRALRRAGWRARTSSLVVGLVLVASLTSSAARAATVYDGHLTLADGRRGGASAALDGAGVKVTGTLSLTTTDAAVAGAYTVSGRRRGRRLTVKGTVAGTKLTWRGRSDDATTVRGALRLRGPAGRRQGTLVLVVRAAGSTVCDGYFRGDVMGRVLLPVCASCHVAGGAAQATRLRVLPDDVTATRASVAVLIDASDPAASLLLQKPAGGLGHGGGRQLTPGGTELQILTHWVELATGSECVGGGTPGGGGGGTPGEALFVNLCASCHGTDARGVGGRPAIRCNRDIADPVKSGRRGPTPETTMPPFLKLTDADIGLIQGFLNDLCPAASATGAELFTGNCATCHGADARGASGPDVHCGRSIGDAVRNGVTGVFGPMPAMLRLTDPEIQRIQGHLLSLCPSGSASGATLYASNCAPCHGVNAEGDGNRRPDIACTVPSRITNAVRKGRGFLFPVMPSFSTAGLTDAELASVIGFIRPHCGGQPADLYASNCATCHGPTGTGGQNANGLAGPNIRCSSSGDVYDAVVDGTGGMPALYDLTNPEIDKVVTFLRTGCN